ncbi:MAG: YtxH domain-containing protein [Elusimicrobiota bacterium]
MEEKNTQTTKGFAGLAIAVTGVIIGTAIGILTAPFKGKESREKVGDWCKDAKQKWSEHCCKKDQAVDTKEAATKTNSKTSEETVAT